MPYTKSGIYLPPVPIPRPRADGTRRKRWSPTQGMGALLSPEGDVLWQDREWVPNALNDEGETDMLSVYLTATANPAKYVCLINGGTTAPTETSTMAYLGGGAGASESQVPAANGYNRQQILTTDWTSDGLISGDARYSSASKTFGPATGAAWTATHAGLVTAATGQLAGSGKFLLFLALSASTTIAINQSLVYLLRMTQS